MRICVTIPRIGPYHAARLKAAAALGKGEIVVVESRRTDAEYAWDEVQDSFGYQRVTLLQNEEHPQSGQIPGIKQRMYACLNEQKPDAIVITGWAFADALAALSWCVSNHIPAVVMSESQQRDHKRVFWRELLKRQLVGLFSAGLVGGQPHKQYLTELGMAPDKIFMGYDVVDNDYFIRETDKVQASGTEFRNKYGLPQKYFLASNRFIEKKNLPLLIDAYAEYRKHGGHDLWELVMLGDGPLREQLRQQCDTLGIGNHVLFPGFIQYDELPVYYGLAGVFVHASTTEQWGLVINEAMASSLPIIASEACGCVPDLVHNKRNGIVFNPNNVGELSTAMTTVASDEMGAMQTGQESHKIISEWTPDRFAQNLWDAVETATSSPAPKKSLLKRATLSVMGKYGC